MAQYVLINKLGTRRAGEIIDTVQDPGAVQQLAAFGGVLIPLPSATLQPYIEAAQLAYDRADTDEAQDIMMAGYASSTSIAGGGTAGFVPIWTAGSVLGDSVISQSGSLVGINVAAPTAALSLPSGVAGAASMNFGTGVAPGAPNSGDLWFDGTYLYLRASGINQPLNAPFGTGTPNVLTKWSSVSGLTDTAITEASGAIRTIGITNAGAGATNGTYSQQALTTVTGTGTGATADIVVSGNVVTVLTLRSPGTGYAPGDTLSCATIGGGGFVFTVSAVSASDNASGNVTGLRFGVGTSTPRGGIDLASGAMIATSQDIVSKPSTSTTTNTGIWSTIYAAPSFQVSLDRIVEAISVTPRADYSLMPSGHVQGVASAPQVTVSTAAQTTRATAYQANATRFHAGDASNGATTEWRAALFRFGPLTGVGATSTSLFAAVSSTPAFTAVGHTVGTLAHFYAEAWTFNVASTITNYYGFRQLAPTGVGTITNRWGVSVEDAATKSAFWGNLGVGNALDVGAGKVIASLTLTNGGTLYTAGTYPRVSLTGGTGSGATANIIVSGGAVTTLVLMSPGQGYTNGDVLSVNPADVGGTGSGFQATVATTASILRSDGTVIGSRIGGGTTNPVASIDGSAAASFNGFSQFFPASTVTASTGVVNYSTSFQMVSIGARSTDLDCTSVGTNFLYGINIVPILENLSGNFQGIQVRPLIRSSSGAGVQASSFTSAILRSLPNDLGTMNFSNGYFHSFALQNGAGTAASYNNTTVRAFGGSHIFSSPGTTTESSFFRATVSGTSTHTITTNTAFWQVASTISGGTTIGTHYGLRLGVITITAPSAITNYWGVFQEDPAAKSAYYGNLGVGNALNVGAGKVIASLTLTNAGAGATNGTYSQVALTGGSGTGATADIVVSGNVVTSLVLRNPGQGYVVGDTLSTAAIGGAGFVFTVATTASIIRSDGTAVASRVGAGTATPRAGLDVAAGGGVITGVTRLAFTFASGTITSVETYLAMFGTVAPTATNYGLIIAPQFDLAAGTINNPTLRGVHATPVALTSTAGTTQIVSITGGNFEATRTYAADLSTNTSNIVRGVSGAATINASVGAASTGFAQCFSGTYTNAAAAHTVTDAFGYRALFSNSGTTTTYTAFGTSSAILTNSGTITTLYGLRLPSITNTGTITNRWGVSVEDAATKSAFWGNLGVGNALDVGAGKVIASLTLTNGGTGYTNGTYQQVALTTVTGTGSGATADIVVAGGIVTTVVLRNPGQGYAVSDTLSCASIGAGVNFLLTVATTASILRSDGTVVGTRVGGGTTNPVAALHGSGGAYFEGYRNFVTDNGAPAFSNQLWTSQTLFGAQSTATVVNNNLVAQLFVTDKFDTRSLAVTANTYSARFVNRLFASNAGQTVNCFGTQVFLSRDQAADDNATNVLQQAVLATSNANRASGSTLRLSAFVASVSNFQAGHTVDLAYLFHAPATTHAGTTATLYGLRLEAPTVTGTITNRYWIAQEDTLGSNYVRAKTFFGPAVGTAAATNASVEVTAQGTLNGDIRLNSANAVVDVSAASTNGVKFNNRGGAGITGTTQFWYEEGTYTPTLSAGWTATAGNYAGYWTRNGRLVTLTIQFTGGTNSGAAGGSTISTPVGLTPARNGAGSAVNANGTALGNGVVVVTTAATIINANAITTTTVDKTIVVQYEV